MASAKSIPYRKFAEVYDSLMDQQDFYESYYNFITNILRKLDFNPKNILELGCGTGKLAEIFLRNGYDVEGLDLSQAMLAIARKRGLKIHHGNMADFSLGKKYGLIMSIFDSINYLQTSCSCKNVLAVYMSILTMMACSFLT